MINKLTKHWKKDLLFFISFIFLFFSFQFNAFSAANQNWFEKHQFDSEALVIGRLIKSREDGIFSDEGRLGRYSGLEGQINEIQTKLYLKELNVGNFRPYGSQVGLQGIFFSSIDRVLEKYELIKIENRIAFFHAISSALQALVLSVLIVLIYLEIGLIPSLMVLLSMMFSQWLVVFGKNLYWVMGLMFIPMTIVWLSHKIEEVKNIFYIKLTLLFLGLSIFLKAATGYEYISTILISMVAPIVYFSVKNGWSLKKFFKRILLFGFVGIVGFLLAFFTHTYQSSVAAKTTFKQTVMSQVHHATSRMDAGKNAFGGGTGSWARGARASRVEVLDKYWNGKAIDLQSIMGWKYFKLINFFDLIYIFLIFSALGLMAKHYSPNIEKNRKVIIALIVVTWFSFLAPISWYVLAKVHSYVHGHMNHVLWHMPFTIFGFALVGYILYLLSKDLYERNKALLITLLLGLLLLISFNFISSVTQANEKIDKLFKHEKFIEIEIEKNIKLIITPDGKLIYYITHCNSSDIADKFFLHIYPENKKYLNKNQKHSFNNYDFKWSSYAIDISKFSKYGGSCIAVRELPVYSIKTINTGRYKGSTRFWQKQIEMTSISKKADKVSAFNLSNKQWKNGISNTKPALFTNNTLINRLSLKENNILKFPFSGERIITKIDVKNNYINIEVNGSNLDPIKDGYPHQIKIIKGNTH